MSSLTDIWREVSGWPPDERRVLATRLLQSLEEDEAGPVPRERQQSLEKLIGIWKTEHPPTDEEVEHILEEARMKKYGK
jgi:hypothetical protein